MIEPISLANLSLVLLPVLLVIAIQYHWRLSYRTSIHAVMRMLVQLMLVGYLLIYIFDVDRPWIVLLVLVVMVMASTYIALRTVASARRSLFGIVALSLLVGSGSVLALVIVGVIELDPWYTPKYMVPLAGMIFSNSMTSISLAAERVTAELSRGKDYDSARNLAFDAALIPTTNALFAVGLVALPGMMTGQILSGVSPLIAVRYQIMIMGSIYGAAGISTLMFLYFAKHRIEQSVTAGTQDRD